jgi:[acyl-carrier-protein] S-malonyltransferase
MSVALLFPGQGSQQTGMGKDLFQSYPTVKATFDRISQTINIDIEKLCFKTPQKNLTESHLAQVAIFSVSMGVLSILKAHQCKINMTSGHSLGWISSLVAAGCLTLEDGARLVKERGILFSECSKKKPGKMVAVLGVPIEEVTTLCKETSNRVSVANINSYDQIVVAGESHAADHFCELVKQKASGRVVPLQVSGAFHTSLMQEAADAFKSTIESLTFSDPLIPVISNLDGRLLTKADDIVKTLHSHIMTPVDWQSVMATVYQHSELAIEVGFGKILKGLFLKQHPDFPVLGTSNVVMINHAIKEDRVCPKPLLQH